MVIARCRPLNDIEISSGHVEVSIACDTPQRRVVIKSPKGDKAVIFDAVLGEASTQSDLFLIARPVILSVLEGFNGTIFSYGQTGSGKTWTMQGLITDPKLCGITPTSIHFIFEHIAETKNRQFLVRASYLEIYDEKVRDLLLNPNERNNSDLKPRETKEGEVFVPGLKTVVVKNATELLRIMDIGNSNRSVAATLMNSESSRSHSIFKITVESSYYDSASGTTKYLVGHLNLVDLAGSERQSKSGSTGDRFKEATNINLALSALGKCISALADGMSNHIPFRDSILTSMSH